LANPRTHGPRIGCAAHRDAARGASFRVERGIARAGYAQHAQLRQPVDERSRQRRALAHRQDNLEIRQLRGGTSSSSNACAKNTTSARANNGDQSALLRATPCQSSRTATLVIISP
jgi:hypothetical protein